jgi:hypothetical protein
LIPVPASIVTKPFNADAASADITPVTNAFESTDNIPVVDIGPPVRPKPELTFVTVPVPPTVSQVKAVPVVFKTCPLLPAGNGTQLTPLK